MRTHYDLLGLEPASGADAIKQAFRREIARYHPDKVAHLGAEFQEMAAARAAELTIAYKTLTDTALREEYDASMSAALPPLQHGPSHSQPSFESFPDSGADAPFFPQGSKVRFASERADRDQILKRAIARRVLSIVEALYGKVEMPAARGFDLAMVPVARPRFLGPPPPRVLIRVLGAVDAAAVTDSYTAALRARVHSGKSPVVVMLFAPQIAPQPELSKAIEASARQRKGPDGPDEIAVVVINAGDWSCKLPPGCSAVVQKLANQVCA